MKRSIIGVCITVLYIACTPCYRTAITSQEEGLISFYYSKTHDSLLQQDATMSGLPYIRCYVNGSQYTDLLREHQKPHVKDAVLIARLPRSHFEITYLVYPHRYIYLTKSL